MSNVTYLPSRTPSEPLWGEPVRVLSVVPKPLLKPEDAALALNCTVDDLEVRWQAGDVERYTIGSLRRYELVKSPAAESNRALRGRSSQSGYTGQGLGRREYMRAYQRAWVARRRAEFFVGKTCLDCGATEDLELHHRDPDAKVRSSDHAVWSWSLERREAEIAKCDVICNGCHLRRHGKVPGGQHGGRHRYEIVGCRCDVCVAGARERRRIRYARTGG